MVHIPLYNMSSHNSKYYKKSLKINKVVSYTLDTFLEFKRDDNNW